MINFDRFPGGRPKACTVSYDDGREADRRLVEIFDKNGIRGSFHLNSGRLGTPGFVTAGEIAELFKKHEISAHGLTHQSLSVTPSEMIANEILEDRKNLEALTGYPVRGMSYPYGDFNESLLQMLPSLGIEYSRTVEATGGFSLPANFLRWPSTCHHNNNLLEHSKNFLAAKSNRFPLLLYVWGHSFEFDRENNWDMIQEFGRLLAGRDDIWYATNIEIVDYVNAVKGLRFSANRRMILNGSASDVWISIDEEPIKIRAGETVHL